jgi:hypothetical protein
MFGNVGNKIFKTDLIKHPFNSKHHLGEDLEFSMNYIKNITKSKVRFLNVCMKYNVRSNSSVRQVQSGTYLDVLRISLNWEQEYDLSLAKNMYIVSAINEHAYIYSYIRVHMDSNKDNKAKYKKLLSQLTTKRKVIKHRTKILLILSCIFKIHCEFFLIPFIKIFKRKYLKK